MERTQTGEARRRHFHSCGTGIWLYVDEAGTDLSLRCSCCHDRFCDACQKTRGSRVRRTLMKHLDGKFTRFLTFTLKHNTTPLRDQVSRLMLCFATLRRRAAWREHIVGGAAFVEVKIGRDKLWHVHVHVLAEGRWWAQVEIAKEWHAVTGDSYIVDIQAKGADDDKARYCTKYITKPCSDDVYAEPARLDEFLLAMKGRRLVTCFGSWRGLQITDDPEPDPKLWLPLGNLSQLAANSQAGDPLARRYIEAALRKWPNLGDYVPHPTLSDYDASPP